MKKQSGLALLDVLIVIVVVAILAVIIIPHMFPERKAAVVPSGEERMEFKVTDPGSGHARPECSVATIGNRSFVRFLESIRGNPSDHAQEILNTLSDFERSNLGLEITGWFIEKQQDAYATCPMIFGLWIDHKPKNRQKGD